MGSPAGGLLFLSSVFYASCVVVYVLSHVWLFCDPMTVVGSSVHGISWARRLEWVAISFSWELSWPRNGTCVSCLVGRFFTTEPPERPLFYARDIFKVLPALKLSAKNPAILGLVYREESGRDSEERNLKGLLQKCLFLAQSHFSRWHRIPGSDINSVQWQFSWYMLKYVTTCWWKLPGHLVHGWTYDLEVPVWFL